MKYLIIFLLSGLSLFAGKPLQREINFYKPYLEKWEGYKTVRYFDKGNIPTVGIGHNLKFEKYNKLGSVYSRAEIEYFFSNDLEIALNTARSSIRNFDGLHPDAKLVVISMIWQTGPQGFLKWENFRLALSHKMYSLASTELKNSKWWREKQSSEARRQDHFSRLDNINQK